MSRLLALLRPERQDLGIAVVYSIAIGLLSLAVPVAAQALVNTIAFGSVLQPLVVLGIAVFFALTVAGLLQLLRTWTVEMIQRRVFVRLAGVVADRLLRVRVEAFDRQHGPELVNRFMEVITVKKSIAHILVGRPDRAMNEPGRCCRSNPIQAVGQASASRDAQSAGGSNTPPVRIGCTSWRNVAR